MGKYSHYLLRLLCFSTLRAYVIATVACHSVRKREKLSADFFINTFCRISAKRHNHTAV